jgi:hypothetical protein
MARSRFAFVPEKDIVRNFKLKHEGRIDDYEEQVFGGELRVFIDGFPEGAPPRAELHAAGRWRARQARHPHVRSAPRGARPTFAGARALTRTSAPQPAGPAITVM